MAPIKSLRTRLIILVGLISALSFTIIFVSTPLLAAGVDQAKSAAEVQAITNLVKQCVSDNTVYGPKKAKGVLAADRPGQQYENNGIGSSYVKQGDIFYYGTSGFLGFGSNYKNVGYGIESKISKKITDGKVSCDNKKILNLFVKAIKGSEADIKDIICSSNGESGLLLSAEKKQNSTVDGRIKCADFSNSYVYKYKTNDEANAVIENLYENWRKNNKFAQPYQSVGSYTGAAAYHHYLGEFMSACVNPQDPHMTEEDDGSTYFGGSEKLRLSIVKSDGTIRQFYVSNGGKRSDKVTDDECAGFIKKVNRAAVEAKDLIQQSLKESGADDALSVQGAISSASTTSPDQSDFTDNCFNQTGFIGWMICPATTMLNSVLESAYDKLVEPMLKVSPELVNSVGENNATYKAWGIFRNFANIIFIILFLGVIISQVTGFGIDNYGIKKILPKLIITAILINLSFYICQLTVDISNMAGFSLRTLFEQIAKENLNSADNSYWGTFKEGSSWLATILAGGGGLLIAFKGALTYLIGPLFMVLLSAVISVFFLFVILAARKAIIILLIATAPIAIAFYALPNTNSLFKKWLSLFKTLLVVYPVCGLLIGAGAMASSVIIRAGAAGEETITMLVGIIIQVVPFFFVPSLVKKAVDGAAGLGSRIAGFNKFSGALNQRAKTGLAEARTKAAASKGVFGWRDKLANSKVGKATGYNRRRASMVAADFKRRNDELSYNRMNSDAGRATMLASLENKEMEQAIKDEEAAIANDPILSTDIRAAGAALSRELSSANPNANRIKALQNHLSAKGDDGRQAVHNAMESAQASGNVTKAARQAYSQNLMNNWAKEYKANSRSTFDYAKNNQGEAENGTLADAAARSATSLTHSQLASMDEPELGRYVAAANSLSAADQSALLNQVELALKANSDGKLDIKDKQLVKLKELRSRLSSPPTSNGSSPAQGELHNNPSGTWEGDYNDQFLPGNGNGSSQS